MRLPHRITLHAFRDVGIGQHDTQREFSPPVNCWARIEPRGASRVIGDMQSFGAERAVTHLITLRNIEFDVFTYIRHSDDWYKVFQTTLDERRRFITVGAIFEQKAPVENLGVTMFNL